MERLTRYQSAVVQEGEHSWSIYVSADVSGLPTVVYGLGVDPNRISLFDREPEMAPVLDGTLSG
jgi:hypothetical protein